MARTSLASIARRTSASPRFLKVMPDRVRSNSSVRILTSRLLTSPPTTPTVTRFRPAMSVMAEPGGATSSTTVCATTATACACERSPTSPLTTARSTLPDENASAASAALPASTILSRTGAFCCASLPASAETSRVASPSSEPTAIVSVVGRAYQRQANRLAPATRTAIPATRVIRSQMGSLVGFMRHPSRQTLPRQPPCRGTEARSLSAGMAEINPAGDQPFR